MKTRLLLLAPLALVLGGCAKYPNGSGVNRYTRLTFRFTLDGPVDPKDIYGVAIRAFTTESPTDLNHGPVPVVAANDTSSGSPNGFVAGRPDRLVRYVAGDSIDDYFTYRFIPASDPNDSNTLDEAPIGTVVSNSGLDPNSPPSDAPPNTLGFTIDTSYLVNDPALAQTIKSIQFNIIATNKRLIGAGDAAGRGIDAIGDQTDLSRSTFNNPIFRQIVTSGQFSDTQSSVPERTGDVFGVRQPAIDVKSWSLRVDLP